MFHSPFKARLDRERARYLVGDYAAGAGTGRGIVAGSRIATSVGWQAVEVLRPGARVVTFGGGLRPVLWLEPCELWSSPRDTATWPLAVPAGALGNGAPMVLLPTQSVVIEVPWAEAELGTPFVLMPCAALDGHAGIGRRRPTGPVSLVRLGFEREEVVFSNNGAMFRCGLRQEMFDEAPLRDPGYASLAEQAARTLLAQGAALTHRH